jgi:branched-chain amino acid transport system permease protein
LFHFTALKRILKGPELATLLATYALGVVLEELVKHVFTSESRGYTWEIGGIDLGITVLPWRSVLAAGISVTLALTIYFWFQHTRFGTATRAVVQDDVAAAVCGINVPRVYATTFALGTSLALASGVLVALYNPSGISPGMGHAYTLKAFVIAVLGGLTSPYGAFFAGLVFGVVENGSYLLLAQVPGIEPISAARFLSFVVLLAILLVRPTGLLGAK